MTKGRVDPRDRLASNLKALIESGGQSVPEIAARAGVDRKTINNLLNRRFDPRLSLVEKVANAIGMSTWQLLATDLDPEKIDSKQIMRLVDHFSKAKGPGREAIMNVAEIASDKATR